MTQRAVLVDQYLRAIGVDAQPPSRDLLDRLVFGHVATLAFASAGVRLGDALPLDPASVHDRLVVRRRGGYCFEHNLLMFEALSELGFAPTMYLARVLVSGAAHPALTHRVSVVEIDGDRILVDVGFGPQGPTGAVPFDGTVVGEPWRCFRLTQTGPAEWTTLAAQAGTSWEPMYRFELTTYGDSDCELGHFYSHRHPDAHFVRVLVGSRLLVDETRSLRNRDYWIVRPDGVERRRIDSAQELRAVLVDELGVHADEDECAKLFGAL
jgi:N-hydroxyarylamine O-acetyltransferase